MIQEETWFEADDGTKLFLRRRFPDSQEGLRAVVLVLHGMAEHGGRYERLAEKLTAAGMAVWVTDQRGHGKTADLNINGPGKGGFPGHCADDDGFGRVTADLRLLVREIRKIYPGGVPLFLLGHSWGSFIVQNYIERYEGEADGGIKGCVLSGTRGPGGFRVKASIPMMGLFAFLWGQRRGSVLARAIVDGPYNRPFRPNRTAFDWLSRDEAVVDAFVHDPSCGNLCSIGFYRNLLQGLFMIHREESLARIRKDLPIYIFSGSADPVGEMGESPTALVNVYRSLGIKDLEFVLYPGARHETFNETNQEEVTGNLLAWISRHCAADSKQAEAAPAAKE